MSFFIWLKLNCVVLRGEAKGNLRVLTIKGTENEIDIRYFPKG